MEEIDTQHRCRPRRGAYQISKRIIDVTFSLVALVLLSPVLLGLAAAIKMDSQGPVFYRGIRTGMHGRKFRIWKFRTMTVGAELEGTTTVLGDARVTSVGRFMRHTKLDELPQFLNVLSGSMSIVGPRPEVEEHTNQYSAEEIAILSVKPGITDFSSLRYFDMATELGQDNPHEHYVNKVRNEKNQLRLKYVKESSIRTDLSILGMTLAKVIRRLFGLA